MTASNEELLAALPSTEPGAQLAALADVVEGAQPPGIGDLLMPLLQSNDELVRANVVDALGVIAHRDAIGPVVRLLRSPLVRAAAAETLGDLGLPGAIPGLIGALADGDCAVRGYAASSLGLLGDAAMLDAVRARRAIEEVPTVCMELDGATARLGGRDGLRSLFATLESVEVEDGINLLNVLGDLLQRRTPVSTVREEHEAALARAALRLPILGGQIGSLLKRVRDRSQKDWTEEEW